MDIQRISPGANYGALFSAAAAADRFVFVGGTTAWDGPRDGDVESQTRFILGKIDGYLAACGTNKARVLVANVYLADIATWEAMNRAWLDWIDPASVPARVSVEARLLEGLRVEITCVALRPAP